MARGPIGHTCPDINREQGYNSSVIKELQYVLRYFHRYEKDELESAIESAVDRLNENNDFLEEMRSANDKLRTWGTEMEDKANQLEEELINVTQ